MDGRRTALIVASDEFEHTGLSRLQAPAADAEALAQVLGDPDIGGFDVRVVHNSPSHTVQAHVEDLFAEGRPDDLLLLHFSGHGLKSDSGELFFAATNTRPDRLASTAVSADFVQRCMRGSRARSIVLFLDCCYGGAFGEGVAVRAAGPANVLDSFPAGKLGGGRGRAVITASSAMEYAFEGSSLATADQRQPSVFTSAVVEGLSSGAADRDEDGLVSLNELYDYVFDQVRAQNPNQTPSRDIELQGELYVARSRRKRIRPVPLPADLQAAVNDGNMYTRLGAVGELRARLASPDPGVALGAREALEAVARSDTSYVAEAARDALAGAPAEPEAVTPRVQAEPGPSPRAAFLASPAAAPEVRSAPDPQPDLDREPLREPLLESVPQPRPEPRSELTSKPAQVKEPAAEPSVPAAGPPHTEAGDDVKRWPVPPGRAQAHRTTAGRTVLTGGALVMLAALLPEFVYGSGVFSFRTWLGIVLLVVGGCTVGVGAATLVSNPLRRWWPVLVLAVATACAVTVVLLLGATGDLGASDIHLGLWVALGGSLTTAAAGVVALVGMRREPGPPPRTPTTLTRTVGRLAIVSSATMLVATFAVRFSGHVQALLEPNLVWAWIFPGLVGLVAGILTLRLRRWRHVGPAIVAGAGAAAIWGLWDMPRIWNDEGTSELDSGYFLELGGLVGLVAAAVGALVCLHREHGLSLGRPAWRTLALTVPVGLLGAVPFGRVAKLSWESSETGNAVHDVSMVVTVVALPLLVSMLRPGDVARFVLLGWTFGTVGIVVAYWRLLRYNGAPLLGVPYVLLALAVLAVVATANQPWRQSGPSQESARASQAGSSQAGSSQAGSSQAGSA